MFHDDEASTSTKDDDTIRPGEDLSGFSLDGLAERRRLLEEEIKRIDEITDKKKAGMNAAEAVFKI
ncbi:DUF1192 domain-containing protein [Maricaulis sp.]|uniref:DUF1192 domain-containing protein n=1 Tax=unclassified Maricaulis TaxID=2632371 RepID=UPI001B239AE7|nr:DUF1192 domain-containing protein [Maricaulis sp.]MBO6797476.1 DUF1192 domain-containing protein [Maricaulis sp.]